MDFLNSTKCDQAFDEEEDYEIEQVDIWFRQRNGRKCITEVVGLAKDLNVNKIVKCWRHEFHCAVSRIKNEKGEKIVRMQGDQRNNVYNFLIEEKIIDKEHIKIHGY